MEELSKEAKEARNSYYREWRKKNPEKIKENNRKYWEKKASQLKEKETKYAE